MVCDEGGIHLELTIRREAQRFPIDPHEVSELAKEIYYAVAISSVDKRLWFVEHNDLPLSWLLALADKLRDTFDKLVVLVRSTKWSSWEVVYNNTKADGFAHFQVGTVFVGYPILSEVKAASARLPEGEDR